MILDFRKNAAHALRHNIFDAVTGEDIGAKLHLVYADDKAGIIHRFLIDPDDEQGGFVLDAGGDQPFELIEERAIRIELKPEWANPVKMPEIEYEGKGTGW